MMKVWGEGYAAARRHIRLCGEFWRQNGDNEENLELCLQKNQSFLSGKHLIFMKKNGAA